MALHRVADSTDLRLFVLPHRRLHESCSLTLPILSGPLFKSSPATLLDDVQGRVGLKALGPSKSISQTTLEHLHDFDLEVGPEFLRIVGIVSPRLSASSRLYSWERSRPGAGGHPAELGWMAPSYRDVSPLFGVATRSLWWLPKNSALRNTLQYWRSLQRPPTCIGSISSLSPPLLEYQVQRWKSGLWNQGPPIISLRVFAMSWSIEDLSSLDPEP